MIDFKEEIGKYKPIRTVDEVEDGVRDEITDIMDLLQYISNKPEPTIEDEPTQVIDEDEEEQE